MKVFGVNLSWASENPYAIFDTFEEANSYGHSMCSEGESYQVFESNEESVTITLPKSAADALTEGCACCVYNDKWNSYAKAKVRRSIEQK